MKEQLRLILKTLADQYDSTVPADKFEGATEKDIFLSGAMTALIIVNGLDTFNLGKETKP